MTGEPISVDVQRDTGITLVFDDGVECTFANDDLRLACPCATCRGLRDQGRPVAAPEGARIEDAQLVGNWGIGILWNDGHATGIFPWSALREWCEGEGNG